MASTVTRSLRLASAVVVCMTGSGAASPARAQTRVPDIAAQGTPTLIVFITVDQMRPDYFNRWAPQLTGGLARLSGGGAFFTNAYQDHGYTVTAPGHSVLLSGRFPRSTGIVSNTEGVDDAQAPLLTSREAGASPFRFRGSTLIDWMRVHDARSRALSISRKDRGAILPLGRAKQSAFWYASSIGEFTSSRYYGDTLPTWIRRVNERRTPQRTAGHAWSLLLNERQYAEPDSAPQENAGRDFTFPHPFGADSARAAAELPNTPWMDRLTLDAALEGVQALKLGTGPQADLLAISLSATDAVGHRYGPDSREQHDNILRLDRALGSFLDSLFRLRDSSRIVVALTADHGMTSFPELVAHRAHRSAPARYDTAPAVAELRADLRHGGLQTSVVRLEGPLVIVDREAFARARVSAEPVLHRFVVALRSQPGISRVDRVRDLARRDTLHDVIARRWLHMIPPDAAVEYVVTPRQGAFALGGQTAEHGSPYEDDAHVPLILYGPWFRAGRFDARTLVVDLAPTLARVLEITPTERLDGRVLDRALARPR